MFTCYHTHWGLIKDDVGALDIEWENNSDNASGNAAWSMDIFTYGFSIIYVSQRNLRWERRSEYSYSLVRLHRLNVKNVDNFYVLVRRMSL